MSAAETLRVAGDRLPGLPDTTQLGVTGDHPVVIYFSSGTTGPQKAVMLSHRNIHAQFVISWSATFQFAFSFGCCLIDIVFLGFFSGLSRFPRRKRLCSLSNLCYLDLQVFK